MPREIQEMVVSIENGDDIREYYVTVSVAYTIDEEYGEDADGNRGTVRTFLDDFEIFKVVNEDGDECDFDEEIVAAVEAKLKE